MDWLPLYDKVLVRRDKPPEALGGLHVPDVAKQPPQVGTVIAAGEGRLNVADGSVVALRLQPGYRVYFAEFSGVAMPDFGDDVLLLREDEVLAFAMPEVNEPEA